MSVYVTNACMHDDDDDDDDISTLRWFGMEWTSFQCIISDVLLIYWLALKYSAHKYCFINMEFLFNRPNNFESTTQPKWLTHVSLMAYF
jgi:hypothetical protein